MQRQPNIQFRDTYCKDSSEDARKERNLRIQVEKTCSDIEEQKDAESDITTNFEHK
jgi:hypothetical protein